MKDKIRKYVEYQFRFQNDQETKELIEEIVANLCDRYDALYQSYLDEDKAYLEAIKQMGEFKMNHEKGEAIKPSIMDMFLVVSIILAIFGLIIIFFHLLTGIIITALSIILYAIASNHLYQLANYAKIKEMDIEKHHMLLSKIYKFMKTNFIFWAISLTLIIATIPSKIIMGLSVYYTFGSLDPSDFESIVQTAVISSFVVFILSAVVISLILSNVYRKLQEKYIYLVGEAHQESYLKDATHLIDMKKRSLKEILFHPVSVFLVILSVLILSSTSALIIRFMTGMLQFSYEYISIFEMIDLNPLILIFILISLISIVFGVAAIFDYKHTLTFDFVALILIQLSGIVLYFGISQIYFDDINTYYGIRSNYNYSIAISFLYVLLYFIVMISPKLSKRLNLKISKSTVLSIWMLFFTIITVMMNFLSGFYKTVDVTDGIRYENYFLWSLISDSIFFPIAILMMIGALFLSIYQMIHRGKFLWLNYLLLSALILSSLFLKIGFESIFKDTSIYDGINRAYDYAMIATGVHLLIYSIYSIYVYLENKKS
jgi:hypothetical protein